MNSEEILKYLGLFVLTVVLIYFICVVLKVNNDFIGTVMGKNLIEGLSNKENIAKEIENKIAENNKLISTLNDIGADYTENSDKMSELISTSKEVRMKSNIVDLLNNKGAFDTEKYPDMSATDKLNVCELLNEMQEYMDSNGKASSSSKKGFFS